MRKKLLVSFVLTVLLLVVVSPLGVSVGVEDFDGESRGFVAQSTVDWWPMFHHDVHNTGYSTSVVQEYIKSLWNYTTGAGVRCSSAVFDGKVFVGSEDGYVYALNATTGVRIEKSTKIGSIISSPAVAYDRVFVGSINGSIYALDETTLEIIWNCTTGGAISSSPAVADGKVYVGSWDNKVRCLNASTGASIWNKTTGGDVRSSPAVVDGKVYVGSDSGYVYKLQESNGYEIWRFRTADPVRSSPAVVDGKVFVGVDDGRVYALNATTGKYLWHFETGDAVVSSPAVADGMVFVGSNDTRVYALDGADGSQIWNFTTGGPVVSSPAVAFDKVFVGSGDNRIYALDVADPDGDGIISPEEVVWSFPTGGPVESSPAIVEGKVFVGSLDNMTYAFAANKPPHASFDFYPASPIVTQMVIFDASASYDHDGNITSYTWSFGDGTEVTETDPITNHTYNMADTYGVNLTLRDNFKPLGTNTTSRQMAVSEAWPMFRHNPTHTGYSTSPAPVANDTLWVQKKALSIIDDDNLWSSPIVIGGNVYIASRDGNVSKLNASDGSVISPWPVKPGGEIRSSPAYYEGMVFVGSFDGYVYALNASSGETIWTSERFGGIESSPVVSDGVLFIGTQDNYIHALYVNGTEKWVSGDTGGDVTSSPAVVGDMVFVGTDGKNVTALNKTDGRRMWRNATGDYIRSSPTVAYGTVFVGSDDGYVYALNMTNGNIRWKRKIGSSIRSSPAIADNMIFIGSDDGNLYALNATTNNPDGKEIWKTPIGFIRWSSPAVAEGKIFIGTTDGKIYALYEESGDIIWNYQTGGPVDSSPAVLNDTLYVSSKNGSIYAFRSQVHDINVTKVSSSPTTVPQGVPIRIAVTIRNEGTFNETNINVTAYYSNTTSYKAGNITLPSLARGVKITELIQWNTANVTPGTYNISVYATPVLNETETLDNNKIDGSVTIQPRGIRDINVTNVIPFKTVVGQNYSLSVNVTVENQGNYNETFSVTAYADLNTTIIGDEIFIGKQNVTDLCPGNQTTLTFTWNTTGVAKGNYTISAIADQVLGETDTTDNTLVDGTVLVTFPGDVNGDGKVRVDDVLAVALAFGSNYGDPDYDANLDINGDGKIRVDDILTAALNFGQGP